jgi:hypothetical protein
LKIARSIGEARFGVSMLQIRGRMALELGDHQVARACFEEGLEITRRTEMPGTLAGWLELLSRAAHAAGEIDVALAYGREALQDRLDRGAVRSETIHSQSDGEGDHLVDFLEYLADVLGESSTEGTANRIRHVVDAIRGGSPIDMTNAAEQALSALMLRRGPSATP